MDYNIEVKLKTDVKAEQGVEVTQGDYGYDIICAVVDDEGIAVDLTSVTVARFKVVETDSGRSLVNAVAAIVSPPTAGKVKYTVAQNDFTKAGSFRAGITLEFGASKKVTTEPFFLAVINSLG